MPENCENLHEVDTLDDVASRGRKPRQKKAGELKVTDPLSRAMIDWVMDEAESKGWSDKDLSQRSGIVGSTVSNMYRGNRPVNADHFVAFAAAFDLSLKRALLKLVDYMEKRESEGHGIGAAGDQELLEEEVPEYEDDGKYARKKTPAKGVSAIAPPESTRPPR